MSLSVLNDLLTPRRAAPYAVALLVVTWAFYLVSVARSRDMIEPGGEIIGRDYLAFYMAGDMVRRGETDHLYDVSAQQAYQRAFMADINPAWAGTCLYLNPPHFAGVMSWITTGDYGTSLGMWWLLSLVCFVVTALIWRQWLGRDHAGPAILLAVCMPAWFQVLAGGQNTFISLLSMTLFCHLLMTRRPVWAGLALSLLAYKFQLLIVPVGWLVLTRRWRAVIGVLAGGVLTLGVTMIAMGPAVVADYPRFGAGLGELMQYRGFDVHKQCSWYGFFYLLGAGWMPAVSVRILTLTASVVSLALLLPVHAGARGEGRARLPLELGAVLVATLLVSPHLFHYDMLLITLPAVLWLRAAADPEVARATAGIEKILAIGFIALAVAGPLASVTHLQPLPLLMLGWLVILARVGGGVAYVPARSPFTPASQTRSPSGRG